MVRDEQQEAIGHPSPVAAKKGIFDGIFDDEEEVLSPEQAHAKASKDALRMQKQREQVGVVPYLFIALYSQLSYLHLQHVSTLFCLFKVPGQEP